MSTYASTEVILAAIGFPMNPSVETEYQNSVIHVKNDQAYLAVTQHSKSTDSYIGKPSVNILTLYFSELHPNGTLKNTISVAEVSGSGGILQDFIYSKTGKWVLIYIINSLDFTNSSLNIVTSSDGENWGPPTVIYQGWISGPAPTLLEGGDGTLFVEFASHNETVPGIFWLYGINEGGTWKTMKAPFTPTAYDEFQRESAFIDENGNVGVVWDMGDQEGTHDLGLRYSMLGDGSWSEPQAITSNSIPLNGQNPRIFYSAKRGGHYLTVTNMQNGGVNPMTQLFFSSNWTNWELQGHFQSLSNYSVVEFSNGELGMVYFQRDSDETINLYQARSLDGSSWSSPQLIETVKSSEIQVMASQNQRDSAAFVTTFIVSITVLVLLVRLPRVRELLSGLGL
jgi:hypothetical protein